MSKPVTRTMKSVKCEKCGLEFEVYTEQPYPASGGWWIFCKGVHVERGEDAKLPNGTSGD